MDRPTPEQIERVIAAARASLAMEGLHLTAEEEALIRARLSCTITDDEFFRLARELAVAGGAENRTAADGPRGLRV